jgi:cytochrome P450
MLKASANYAMAPVAPKEIPQTKGWPLIGSIPQIIKSPFGFVTQARETYGDIYALNLGLSKVVVLNHPRHAQYIMRDNARNYHKGGALWDAVRDMLGNGLVVSEGDFWLRQRRMMQPQFHRQRIAALTTLMVEAIDGNLNTWEQASTTGEEFNIAKAFDRVTMSVILKTMFGTALNEQEMAEAAEAMTLGLDYIMQGTVTHSLPKWMPIPGKKRFEKAMARFDELVYRIIGEGRRGEGEENHLLAMMLDMVDEETGEGMTDQQLRDEVATLFLAGYETTSITLSWAMYYLGQHPDMMQKLQAEVDKALADRLPTMADLRNLPYTNMVIQESMRMRPPSYWLPRTAAEDDEIDGYSIPAGTNVISFTYMYHHHPEAWENPEQFDPERFTPERVANRHKFAFIPFGAGQRMCIGRDFALMEGQLALAMVLQRFDVSLVSGHEVKPQLSSTLRPKGGVPVYLAKRS